MSSLPKLSGLDTPGTVISPSQSQVASAVSSYLDMRTDLTPEQMEKRRRDWCAAAALEGEQWLSGSEEAQEVDRHIAYIMGKQWSTRRPSYKASPVNNRLMRQLEETTAVLTDIRPTYEVSSEDDKSKGIADVLTRTTRAWWSNQHNDFKMAMAVIHAYISTGYLRVVWNRRLHNGRGDFELQPLGISELLPIGPTHDLQSWEGVIYRSVRPIRWFRDRYPANGWKVKPSLEHSRFIQPAATPKWLGKNAFQGLSPAMQRVLGGSPQYSDSVVQQAPYNEFWIRDDTINVSDKEIVMGDRETNWAYTVKPGGRLYPRGRLIITGGTDFQIMSDGPNYHWHGRWPFIPIRLKPVPWQFHGVSELRSKIPMQDIVNTVLAGILDMIKKALNPPLIFPDNAFSDSVKRSLDPSMPNAKISYNPNSPGIPAYGNPPQLPSFVVNTLLYAQQEMDDDSGLLDIASLSRKKVIPAGDTLDQLKEGQQTIMRLRGRWIEMAMADLGQQMVPNFMQFYTMRRRINMLGISGITYQDVIDWDPATMVPSGYDKFEWINGFSFNVAPGSLLNASRQEHALLMMQLRKQVGPDGMPDMSRKTLFKALDLENVYEVVMAELAAEKNEALASAGAASMLGIGGGR